MVQGGTGGRFWCPLLVQGDGSGGGQGDGSGVPFFAESGTRGGIHKGITTLRSGVPLKKRIKWLQNCIIESAF